MIDEQKPPESSQESTSESAMPLEGEGNSEAETIAPEPSVREAAESASASEVSAASASEVASLKQELEALKQQIDERDRQLDSYKNQLVRTAADFDNFRKRTVKEKEELEYKIKRDTIMDLLPAVDNFERARSHIKPNNDGEMEIHKSYQNVYKDLVGGLKRIGVSAMRSEGEPFDPNYHEAMLQVQTDEHPEDTVIEQLVRGYLLGDRVLRHAMVKVAAPKEAVVTSEEDASASSGNSDL
ncbi:nucleotide exchange factor GrpE [Oscillatoria sp. FACHB-1406]|uniref:nucleotide exchange factor GrpE n=1 Tax=Oscillatoria sp. FACHB-1406 TaxID=2692846 RepID=UPI0016883AE0|nr:nucleotide exchange factor GrpE [Oscillatoria sp. FACHB-1406]MBD2578549.1 nucleotide exchange factor GrpE [Oscillatoria sp. FACHB-1406]